jgi:isoquinoline 1-oxidoreductase beta subunit
MVIGYNAWRGKLERDAKAAVARPGTTLLANWVRISSDGTITVLVPHADMGQGAFTALAMVLAEELDADWSQMRAERAPAEIAFANGYLTQGFILGTKPLPPIADDLARAGFAEAARLRNVQVTGGSFSVRTTGQMGLRVVGASARAMLIEAAARRWNVKASELDAARSVVTHEPSARTATYAELAQAAAEISPPARPRLKTRAEYRLIGSSQPRFDIPAKSTGRETYGIDLQFPDMKVATAMAAPVTGGTLIDVDPAPALALRGVEKVVKLNDAVAIVGSGYWYARRGLLALAPRWSDGGNGAVTSETIARQNLAALAGNAGQVLHKAGDVARAAQGRVVEATYEVPLLYHAAMEPINVTAQWKDAKLTVWCGEQDALGAKANVLDVSGLPSSQVEFIGMPIGGGFGRRTQRRSDHFRQVVELARAMAPHPVKLIWSREEDMAQGGFRPALASKVRATLGEDGKPLTWEQRFIDTPGIILEGTEIPYSIANQSLTVVQSPTHVRGSAWRSVGHTQHAFYTECFIDELARAAGRDPFDYRRDLLPAGSRHRRVLEAAARHAEWGTPLPAGHARGIAVVESFGSVVAEVIEASFDKNGTPRVHRVVAVVDCGTVVHRDTATQQVEGGIVMGLSAALGEAITIDKGAVAQRTLHEYRLMKLAEVPRIEVHFVEDESIAWGGIGEVGVPPATPALVNALAAAGKRVRRLPVVG